MAKEILYILKKEISSILKTLEKIEKTYNKKNKK